MSVTWPTMTDYQEAVQVPKSCFEDGELKQGLPVMNKLGLPRPICGQFASVYELEHGGERWAIKCFLRNIPDLHNRYAKISQHLASVSLPYFCRFDYLKKGIRVRGTMYPIVKMDWVEGAALNHFIEVFLNDRAVLEELETRWLTLLDDLQSVKIAHADLQHGNVLVSDDGNLRLIDYDGMWVPKLKGQSSHETGHPDFQSPLRGAADFHADIDAFAGDVIHIALRALQREPDLWSRYNNGDNLLFKRQDYVSPDDSQLLRDLRALGDGEINDKLDGIIKASGAKARRPSRFFRPKRSKPDEPAPKPSGRAWKGGKPPAAPAPAAPAAATAAPKPAARPAPPPPAPARPAAPPPGPGGWLADHVGGAAAPAKSAAPARAAARAPRVVATPSRSAPAAVGSGPRPPLRARFFGHARVLFHLLLLAPVISVAVVELLELSNGTGDRATAILMTGFGLAGLLGLLSLLTLFTMRAAHAMGATLFFGLTVIIMMLNIFSELLTTGWSDWTGDDPLQCALMLAMLAVGGLGFAVEHTCRRMGVMTRWRPPWSGG